MNLTEKELREILELMGKMHFLLFIFISTMKKKNGIDCFSILKKRWRNISIYCKNIYVHHLLLLYTKTID